jgi:hypothetical protein
VVVNVLIEVEVDVDRSAGLHGLHDFVELLLWFVRKVGTR